MGDGDPRERLTEMRQQLLGRTGAVERDLRSAREPDSEERAIQVENDPVLERLDASGREELRKIEAALARIDAGTYGSCERCGEAIGAERLDALPYAATCIDCAEGGSG